MTNQEAYDKAKLLWPSPSGYPKYSLRIEVFEQLSEYQIVEEVPYDDDYVKGSGESWEEAFEDFTG